MMIECVRCVRTTYEQIMTKQKSIKHILLIKKYKTLSENRCDETEEREYNVNTAQNGGEQYIGVKPTKMCVSFYNHREQFAHRGNAQRVIHFTIR